MTQVVCVFAQYATVAGAGEGAGGVQAFVDTETGLAGESRAFLQLPYPLVSLVRSCAVGFCAGGSNYAGSDNTSQQYTNMVTH